MATDNKEFCENVAKSSGFRTALPQVAAVMVKNVVLLSCGMFIGYPTILVESLSGKIENEALLLTEDELSWIGSLSNIAIALGCCMTGVFTKPFGRKRSMQIFCLPLMGCWLFFAFSSSSWHVFTTLFLGGFFGGLLEAPVVTYAAEITQPHLRGALAGTSVISVFLGSILQYFLATLMRWRTLALVSIAPLVLSILLIFFVPESPYWLLMQGRGEEAQRSLAWLRGWTSVEEVQEEFKEISAAVCKSAEPKQTFEFKMYAKKKFLWPFGIMFYLGFVSTFCGLPALQAYSILIFDTLQVPIDPYYAAFILGVTMLVGTLVCVVLVPFLGKRKTCFMSIIGASICYTVVATYAQLNGILYLTAFEKAADEAVHTWIPLVFLVVLPMVAYSGLCAVPWMLVGEVFPKEVRVTASGLTTAVIYVFKFANGKIFFQTVRSLTLPGTFWSYAATGLAGGVILYFVLPETEGKTLCEIEEHFSGGRRLGNHVKRKPEAVQEKV